MHGEKKKKKDSDNEIKPLIFFLCINETFSDHGNWKETQQKDIEF